MFVRQIGEMFDAKEAFESFPAFTFRSIVKRYDDDDRLVLTSQ